MPVLIFLLTLLFALAIYAITAFLVQVLYNFLASSYGWVEAGYWQVFVALVLLSTVGAILRGGSK